MTLRERIESVVRGEPPEDNESPTSEDGMNAADWMLTFRKTYNIKLPESSIMGRYRMKSMGGDFASASNNHLHVFEVLCSRHLRKLSVWMGNVYYAARANDHGRFVCQHLRRENGMFSGFRERWPNSSTGQTGDHSAVPGVNRIFMLRKALRHCSLPSGVWRQLLLRPRITHDGTGEKV